jgi:hypothetical protein
MATYNDGSINALLRVQASNPLPAQGARTFVARSANSAPPSIVQPGAKASGSSKGNLPRGSLVDIIA